MKHSQGDWFTTKYHGSPEDIALMRKHGREPIPALLNDGSRVIMCRDENGDTHRVGTADCQTAYKRGKGHTVDCPARDANARLMASAPRMRAMLEDAYQAGLDNEEYHKLIAYLDGDEG